MQRAVHPWDRFYRFQVAPWRGERPLDPMRPWLAGNILELGCGNGKLLKPLRQAGHEVTGLDVSWNVLQRLEEGVLGDAVALPFATDSFDTVLDIHCTGHLTEADRKLAMRESARVLRPGGHLIVERLHLDDLRATNGDRIELNTRGLKDGRTTHFNDERTLAMELIAAKVKVVHTETVRRHPVLRGEKVLRASVMAVGLAS